MSPRIKKWPRSYLIPLTPIVLAMVLVGSAIAWIVYDDVGPNARARCPATRVHYERNVLAGFGLTELPWVKPAGSAIIGYLFYYRDVLHDRRFSRSPRLAIPIRGRTPSGSTKILWVPQGEPGRTLLLTGRRLDGTESFSHRESAAGGGFPSIIEIPSAGCWQLTLTTGGLSASLVVEAVEIRKSGCEATPVRRDPHPRLRPGPWISATPASAGILAQGSIVVANDEASVYEGGRAPGGNRARIVWLGRRAFGRSVEVFANRLDGPGRSARKRIAASPSQGYVSDLNLTPAGCWLVTVRGGDVAGIVIFRVIAA
jgi:hypothetical protein